MDQKADPSLWVTLFALGRAFALSLVASLAGVVEGILDRGSRCVSTVARKAAFYLFFCLGSVVALEAVKGLSVLGMVEVYAGLLVFPFVDHDLCRGISCDSHRSGESHRHSDHDHDNGQFPSHKLPS
jgi:hypothetical protein